MLDPSFSRAAVAAVIALIATLAYPSQLVLFLPYWTRGQLIFFNISVACIWITYARVIFTDPGSPPDNWAPATAVSLGCDAEEGRGRAEERRLVAAGGRWCRRCERWKPARTHHCKRCGRCILRMDHHCPWTASCIGYRNLPHFLRFLFYATMTTSYLLLHLATRAYAVWTARHLPAYFSPHTPPQLLLLVVLTLIDFPLVFALLAIFIRTLAEAAQGYTTIETWELERHRASVRRGNARGQVFPYDVGLWENMVAACGYQWVLPLWFNPFARSPIVGKRVNVPGVRGGLLAGVEWEVNGFERPELEWPPRDPEKEGRRAAVVAATTVGKGKGKGNFEILEDSVERVNWAGEVRRRQREDLRRWEKPRGSISSNSDIVGASSGSEVLTASFGSSASAGSEAMEWRNSDGERLADYGVDEDAEEEDEDVPLAVLMRRRRGEMEAASRGVLRSISANTVLR